MIKFKDLLEKFKPYPLKDFRDQIEQGKFKKKSTYSYFGPKDEIYDKRNSLNNLSGRRWVFFLNSVEVTNYPVSGPEAYGHKLRKKHPSPKPPQLMKIIVEFFTKMGGWVLDPFMGVGGTLLGCSLCKRNGVGIDLSKEYIDIYKKVTDSLSLKGQKTIFEKDKKNLVLKELITICDDSRNIPKIFGDTGEYFDLILTDPPYANMQAKEKTGEATKTGETDATPFTEDLRDIGNIKDYDKFLNEFKDIIEKSLVYLKNKKYLIIFTKDFQPSDGHHNMLHADMVNTLLKIKELKFKGYKIWYDKTQNLYPYGYPYSFVSNQFHQFILIFRKEKE